jgi:transcription antitermination factor NusG
LKPVKKIKKDKKMQKIRKYWYVGFIMGKTGQKTIEKINMNFPEIKCWFPQRQVRVIVNGSEVIKTEPLFENYIFIKLPENNYDLQKQILEKTPVAYFLKEDGVGLPIPLNNDDVVHMQAMEDLCCIKIREDYIKKEIEIIKGAYKGFRGICLSRVKGGSRYMVEVKLYDIQKKKVVFDSDEIRLIHEEEDIKIYPESGGVI